MALDVRPIQGWLPVLYVQVFIGPGLIVGVVMGKVDGAVLVKGVVGMPVA